MIKSTTISINPELNEVLKSIKHDMPEFAYATKSRMANVLICQRLNEILGYKNPKGNGVNYLELLDR